VVHVSELDEATWTYIGPEPVNVTISAFGHLFEEFPSEFAEELITLEREGSIYSHFALEGTEREDGTCDFGYYKIPFRPDEIFGFVEACLAYQAFNRARAAGASFDEALEAIEPGIAERVRQYGSLGPGQSQLRDGTVFDNRGCLASFLPPGMESLVCGGRPDRYEALPELREARDRLALVMQAVNNFPTAARILRERQRNRPPFEVRSEYDVQDLLYALLRSAFEDARREEWTPSQAGSAKRIDIVIPSTDAVVEAKFVRSRPHARSIADELRVDFECYHEHPSCKHLIALVHDPSGHLSDPSQFSSDLSGLRQKGDHSFDVTVLVR
jgi:REase_DpnII-MboI